MIQLSVFSFIIDTQNLTEVKPKNKSQMAELNRIKEVLEERGIKQKWLSDNLGKSYAIVNAYVQNRKQPRLEVLYEIAKLLKIDAKDLLISQENK